MKYKYLLIASLLLVNNCATLLVDVIRQDKTEEAKAMLEKGANPNAILPYIGQPLEEIKN